jgi:hypothetical protein
MIYSRIPPAELVSPLRREQCVERLRQSVGSPWMLFSTAYLVGYVREDAMTLRRKIRYRNSFQTILRARLRDDPQGTRISCRFGVNQFVFVFMSIWFAVVVAATGGVFVTALADLIHGGTLAFQSGALVPMGMLAFGVALVAFGFYLARDERDEMLAHLRQLLNAADVPASSPGPV